MYPGKKMNDLDKWALDDFSLNEKLMIKVVKALDTKQQKKVQSYVDRFQLMLNTGGDPAKVAFTLVGLELERQG